MMKSPRLLIAFLVTVILMLMVQNYLLVRKYDRATHLSRALTDTINMLSVMQAGDSLKLFEALTLDSTLTTVVIEEEPSKKLLLVFTTWCSACYKNMDQWNRLVEEIPPEGVFVAGISPDPPSKLREYENSMSFNFPVYSISNDSSLLYKNKWKSYPQTILVDEHAKVIKVWTGVLSDAARKEIRTAL